MDTQNQNQNQKHQSVTQPNPFPLNSILVVTLYAIAALIIFMYSSNFLFFLIYAGAIGTAAVFLQPQMAIYTVVTVVAIAFLLNFTSNSS